MPENRNMAKNNKHLKKSGREKLKTPKILEKKNSRQRHTIGLTVFKNKIILWAQSSMPKHRK